METRLDLVSFLILILTFVLDRPGVQRRNKEWQGEEIPEKILAQIRKTHISCKFSGSSLVGYIFFSSNCFAFGFQCVVGIHLLSPMGCTCFSGYHTIPPPIQVSNFGEPIKVEMRLPHSYNSSSISYPLTAVLSALLHSMPLE